MRAILQRVSSASVAISGETVAAIGPGLLILLGIEDGDGRPMWDETQTAA